MDDRAIVRHQRAGDVDGRTARLPADGAGWGAAPSAGGPWRDSQGGDLDSGGPEHCGGLGEFLEDDDRLPGADAVNLWGAGDRVAVLDRSALPAIPSAHLVGITRSDRLFGLQRFDLAGWDAEQTGGVPSLRGDLCCGWDRLSTSSSGQSYSYLEQRLCYSYEG